MADASVTNAQVHEAVGAVVAAATRLEWTLTDAVASLTRSPLTHFLARGERGNTLTRWARRLLLQGIGSTSDDEAAGRTERLGLIDHADTDMYLEALKRAERLFGARDEVTHSLWLANLDPGYVHAQRRTRSTETVRRWTLAELHQLRQDLANVDLDIFICNWNTSGSGMERMEPRQGDVAG